MEYNKEYKYRNITDFLNDKFDYGLNIDDVWNFARETVDKESDIKLVTDSVMGERQTSELHKINDKYLLVINYDIGNMPQAQADKFLRSVTDKLRENLHNFFGAGVIYVVVMSYRKK